METRQEYEDKQENRLREWSGDIDLLRAKAADANAEGRIEYNRMIEHLEHKQRQARMRLEKLKMADEDAWEDLRIDSEETWNDLKTAFEHAMSKFA